MNGHDGLGSHAERLCQRDDNGDLADLRGLEAAVTAPVQKGGHAAAPCLGDQQRQGQQRHLPGVDGVGIALIELIGEEYDGGHGHQPRRNPQQLQAGIGDGLGLQHFNDVRGGFGDLAGGGAEDAHHAKKRNHKHDDQQGPVEIAHQAPVESVVPDVFDKCLDSG